MQRVLIGAWQAITSGRYRPQPGVSLRAWIAEIARRQASKYLRSARRERLTDPDEMDGESQQARADELIEAEEDRRFLAEQLKSPDEMKSILIAHDLEGRAMTEIAKARQVPLSTTYRWRSAALESLRGEARRRGRGESDR